MEEKNLILGIGIFTFLFGVMIYCIASMMLAIFNVLPTAYNNCLELFLGSLLIGWIATIPLFWEDIKEIEE